MRTFSAVTFLLIILATNARAQAIDEKRIQFDKGTTGTTIEGSLKGSQIVDYRVGASAGQNIRIDFQSSNPSGYFNLLPAGSESAIHIGSSSGNHYDGVLEEGGEYRIRVYLMRNAARRNEATNYSLAVNITGSTAKTETKRDPDFADGLSGGPDYWQVTRLASGDTLNVRSQAGTGHKVVGELANGEMVRNLGCAMVGASRWCQIEAGMDQKFTGWVNGHYLKEGAGRRAISLAPPLPDN